MFKDADTFPRNIGNIFYLVLNNDFQSYLRHNFHVFWQIKKNFFFEIWYQCLNMQTHLQKRLATYSIFKKVYIFDRSKIIFFKFDIFNDGRSQLLYWCLYLCFKINIWQVKIILNLKKNSGNIFYRFWKTDWLYVSWTIPEIFTSFWKTTDQKGFFEIWF